MYRCVLSGDRRGVQILLLLYVASETSAFLFGATGRIDHRVGIHSGSIRAQGDNTPSEPDLFDYFDPLLSPHAYPKGIGAQSSKSEGTIEEDDEITLASGDSLVDNDALGWSSREFDTSLKKSYVLKKPFGISLPTQKENDHECAAEKDTASRVASLGRPFIDTTTTFDPTLSPHLYSNGRVPNVIVGDETTRSDILEKGDSPRRTVGLLLIDHGSRSAESNQRLQDLARLYHERYAAEDNSVIVKAAHMEIAEPSIEDGFAALIEAQVDEIICHPYFLSPGRHVVEDIPRLVSAATESLSITIPVRITPPIGSRTNIMMDAIHSLVQEASKV